MKISKRNVSKLLIGVSGVTNTEQNMEEPETRADFLQCECIFSKLTAQYSAIWSTYLNLAQRQMWKVTKTVEKYFTVVFVVYMFLILLYLVVELIYFFTLTLTFPLHFSHHHLRCL